MEETKKTASTEEDLLNNTTELTEDQAAEMNTEDDTSVQVEEEVKEANPVQELQEQIQALQQKVDEADNRYLRLQADFDNFRRRTRLDQEASEKYRAQKLVTDLLPVMDNFERALQIEVDNDQAKSLLQGMEMVYRSLTDALKKEGVEPIEAIGKEFNPHQHQAVMQGEDPNYGSNTVIEEFQKGYLLKDRVIRPAMVKVNQ
ncbi:nucleotide exchange factor GrpE [Neobacillus dielmonensis]|uniref:nucleotide exchange factor GrpE n=1 Tax=Neobacillus dielmonensis TaxID=1347369 RepID=UPI0005A9FD6A|nr:nucleotide exchange factor GrpE [Neobacillus dielmonensis]